VHENEVTIEELLIGDRISVMFDDIPREEITATVARTLSDTQEGLGPEIEDYVASGWKSGTKGTHAER
jgi:hypothetical protein